jgi:membrane associated rhomboid family serine protease
MALYDRDYMKSPRSSSHSGGFFDPRAGATPVAQFLLAAHVLAYVAIRYTQPAVRQAGPVLDALVFDPWRTHQVWRWVTHAFAHGPDLLAFAVPVLTWAWLGPLAERRLGSRTLLVSFGLAEVVSALTAYLLRDQLVTQGPIAASSAGITAVLFALALRHGNTTLSIGPLGSVPLAQPIAFYLVFLVLLPLASGQLAGSVLNVIGDQGRPLAIQPAAGLVAIGVTLLVGWSAPWINAMMRRMRRMHQPARSSSRTIFSTIDSTMPSATQLTFDQQVDQALAKIARYGEASLNATERALLQEAARRYRKEP